MAEPPDASRAGADAGRSGFFIARNPVALPDRLKHSVVAIGNFDGAHRGHAAVVARTKALAASLARPCLAITFEPHPSDYFAGRSVVFRLTPEAAKAAALERLGLDGMVVLTFDAATATLPAEAFVADILVGRLAIAGAVVGYDFHFGKGRGGSPEFLVEAGRRYGFAVNVVEPFEADVGGIPEAVHSTATRKALEAGDVEKTARLLGHPWFVIGEVVHGEKRGRELGFPTANVRLDPSVGLRHGIYAVRIRVDGTWRGGVASFGRRPTFDNGAPLLETFVFDFEGDLYGKTVEVAFEAWLRGEEKFDSAEALIAQMHADAARARTILGV